MWTSPLLSLRLLMSKRRPLEITLVVNTGRHSPLLSGLSRFSPQRSPVPPVGATSTIRKMSRFGLELSVMAAEASYATSARLPPPSLRVDRLRRQEDALVVAFSSRPAVQLVPTGQSPRTSAPVRHSKSPVTSRPKLVLRVSITIPSFIGLIAAVTMPVITPTGLTLKTAFRPVITRLVTPPSISFVSPYLTLGVTISNLPTLGTTTKHIQSIADQCLGLIVPQNMATTLSATLLSEPTPA